MVFEDLNIENIPAKLLLYVVIVISMWLLPGAIGLDTQTGQTATIITTVKIILTILFLPIVHIIVDKVAAG